MQRVQETPTKVITPAKSEPIVMIIDDDIGLLRLLETVLRNVNIVAVTASSALEGLALIAGGLTPNLILLDIKMPGLCGFEAFTRLRANPVLVGVKIIAFTAYVHELDQDRILGHGFDDYISKPFKKSDFIKVIFQALASSLDKNGQPARACH
jgi:CheY-like chemotaxis protein